MSICKHFWAAGIVFWMLIVIADRLFDVAGSLARLRYKNQGSWIFVQSRYVCKQPRIIRLGRRIWLLPVLSQWTEEFGRNHQKNSFLLSLMSRRGQDSRWGAETCRHLLLVYWQLSKRASSWGDEAVSSNEGDFCDLVPISWWWAIVS